MPTFQQLAEPGRAALQRLHQSADCCGTLFQANNVLALHRCSSVDNLLHPLSLSDDSGLYRTVAALSETGSALPATIEGTEGGMIQPMPTSRPLGRSFLPLPTHQHPPLEPVVGCESPRSRQLVRELLDRLGREMRVPSQTPSAGPRRSPPAPGHQSPVGVIAQTTPPDAPATADRDDHATTADRRQGTSPSFSEIVPESGPGDWFSRHTRHRAAASSVFTAATLPGINTKALQSWVDLSSEPRPAFSSAGRPVAEETHGPEASVLVPGSSRAMPLQPPLFGNNFGSTVLSAADHPMLRPKNSPLPSAEPPQPLQTVPPQPGSAPGTSTSQLEQLVQKWQTNRTITAETRQHAKTGPTGFISEAPPMSRSAIPSLPSAVSPQPSPAVPPLPGAPLGTAISQLEQLVQKWQTSRTITAETRHPGKSKPGKDHQNAHFSPGSSSSNVTPQHRETADRQPPAGPTVSRLSTATDFPLQNNDEKQRISPESKPPEEGFDPQISLSGLLHTGSDADRLFAEVLGRVLNREIRRHGLEEKP